MELEDLDNDDELFQQHDSTFVYTNPDPDANIPSIIPDYGEKIAADMESSFQNMPNIAQERKDEREHLTTKLADLGKQLRSIKNIKNHKMRHLNAKNAERRARIRAQIEQVKQELFDLELEEKGSQVTSTSLVDATVKAGVTGDDGSSSSSIKMPGKIPGWEDSISSLTRPHIGI